MHLSSSKNLIMATMLLGLGAGMTPVANSEQADGVARYASEPRAVSIIRNATLRVGQATRTYRVVVPKLAAKTSSRLPVVFAFHGFGDNKDLMPIYSGLDGLARRHGALVVYPQSRPGAWPLVLDWAKPDFAFFDALIVELDQRYRIDRSRIFVTGMSNGAYFANLLASQRSTTIAAIALHSGGLGALGLATVAIERKYPVMIVHGDADVIVRIEEGRKEKAYYEKHGHPVKYVEIAGLNHAWASKQGINDQIWAFFAQHPLQ